MERFMRALASLSPSSSRSRRVAASLIVVLASVVALAAPACSSSDVASKLYLPCAQNSDCNNALICALGVCRPICKTIADCGNGGTCVTDSKMHAVCQSPIENNTACSLQSDCKAPLACASDFRCRNICVGDMDCNALGISGRTCATDASGKRYCADPSVPGEVSDGGMITQSPPPGAEDAAMVGSNDATTEGSSGSSSSGGSSGSGSSGSGGGDSSREGSADASSDAPPAVCTLACTPGKTTCENGACVACGGSGQTCCATGSACLANLSCNASNTCSCGKANEACCTGGTCSSGLSCNNKNDAGPSLCACGDIGTACCPNADGGAATCSGSAVCAGSACSCVAQYSPSYYGGLVLRVDGTVLASYTYGSPGPYMPVMTSGAGPLQATAVASSGNDTGCAIVNGGVWCFPLGGTITDSTFLGAGLGATTPTSLPVQVVTSINGPNLASVVQIAGGAYSTYATFCAVTSDGSVWCWGYGNYGVLGHGDTANSSYARQVMADASTVLTGAVEVRVGYETTCARFMDGSVQCWGTNTYGELGVPYGTTPPAIQHSYYPVPVAFLGTGDQRTAVRLAANPYQTHCAIMKDTSVVCWGYNNYGQTGAPTSTTMTSAGPTNVLLAAGMAALTGVTDLSSNYYSMCAITGSTLALECWGYNQRGTSAPYPFAYQDNRSNAVSGIHIPLAADYNYVGYVDPSGVVTYDGSPTTNQPPCQ